MIKVHGVHGSPFVRRVLVTLEMKGLDYEIVHQMPFSGDKEYLKINPLGKVPTLDDDGLFLGDSKVICQYLDDAYPELALYPADVTAKGMARWYEDLGCGRIAEMAAGIFFQRFMRPMAFNQEPDEELVERIITKQIPPMLDYLESHSPEEGFIFGDVSQADLALVSPFVNAAYAGYTVDADNWPRFAALQERVKTLPAVAAILEQEAKALGMK